MSPRPWPAQVRRADPDHPRWGDLADALVAAFLEHISDLPSEFSPAHRTATAEVGEAEGLWRQRLSPSYALEAAGFPTAPLGSVPALVESELEDRLLLIESVVADLRRRSAA